MQETVSTAVIGAGPYGLSLAAHLNGRGVRHCVFGNPMATWLNHMPKSMRLKSDGFASNLSAPSGDGTLGSYCIRNGIEYDDYEIPVPLATFTDYALNFQKQYVPEIDRRDVTSLALADGGFRLQLEGGERINARRVVLAVGVSHFDYLPDVLRNREGFVSHSSACHDLARFRNSDVTVIGAGSSATDLAAELHEVGANVRLVARRPALEFDNFTPRPASLSVWRRIRRPRSGLGPNPKSWLYCKYPHLFRHLPASMRLDIVRRHLGPASPWYRQRIMQQVAVITGHEVESATIRAGRIHLNLQNGMAKPLAVSTDHVFAATGYRVDLQRLAFIDTSLRSRIGTTGSMPVLSANFESSVPGLYFMGPAAAGSFGPLLRFVYGAEFAARRIAAQIAGTTDV